MLTFHFDPPLFSHANADAPPTGFAARGFARLAFSVAFSLELLFICGTVAASSSPLLFPSSKKRD
jgi:hypothetical protein